MTRTVTRWAMATCVVAASAIAQEATITGVTAKVTRTLVATDDRWGRMRGKLGRLARRRRIGQLQR